MFERFIASTRRAIVLTQIEAENLGASYIGTEHLLLGLLSGEDNTVSNLFDRFDITLRNTREVARQLRSVEVSPKGWVPGEQLEFSDYARDSMNLALRATLRFSPPDAIWIRPEHILLGLVVSRAPLHHRSGRSHGPGVDFRPGRKTTWNKKSITNAVLVLQRLHVDPDEMRDALVEQV